MKQITIVAPASPCSESEKQSIIDYFQAEGFSVKFAPHAFDSTRFLAGTDENRAQDINDAFADDKTDIIMALRGGYGSPRILDKLDYKTIARTRKPFFGFSDITAMQLALWHKCQLTSYTGFNANFVSRLKKGGRLKETLHMAFDRKPLTVKNLSALVPGMAHAPVVGGTLTMLCGLVGTPYMPNLNGVILVLEDVHEEPYRLDRMLNQLRLAGALSQLEGVVLAGCEDCLAKNPEDGSATEVMREYFGHKKIPVVINFPYGHTEDHIVFPIGQTAKLDANAGTLVFDPYK